MTTLKAILQRLAGRLPRREVSGYDGDGSPPSERDRERAIARAETPLHAPVPDEDRELVEAVHEMLVEARTDEQPVVRPVRRRKVTRRPARWQRIAARRLALRPVRDFAADPLTAPLAGPLAPPVLSSSVRSSEPESWDLESFTDCWTTAEFAAIVAEARAGAR